MLTMTRSVGLALVLSMGLAGCQEMAGVGAPAEDPSTLTAAEQQLRKAEDVRKQRRRQATVAGCAAGAGAGALIGGLGALLQGDTTAIMTTVATTAVGCAIGNAAGNYVNKRTAEYANDQQKYNAMIAAADQDVAEARRLRNAASTVVSQQRQKVASLNRKFEQGAVTRESYRSQLASSRNNIQALENQIKAIDSQVKLMREDSEALRANSVNTSSMNSRISQLTAERNRLEDARQQLTNIYNDVPPAVEAPTL